jgi:gluconokinase
MPPALLHSQFETLEPPGPDERPITVEIGGTPDEIVRKITEQLG